MISFLKEFLGFFNRKKKILVIANYNRSTFFGIIIVLSQGLSSSVYLYNFLSDKILGISAFYHDSAAALIINGKIISAAQEERFSRKKHDSRYPYNAVQFVLNKLKFETKLKLIYIVFFEKPFLKFERLLETYLAFAPEGFCILLNVNANLVERKTFPKKFLFDQLKQHDKDFDDIEKIKFSEHHHSHAASAFYPSPLKMQS